MASNPYPKDSLPRLQAEIRDILAVIDTFCKENAIDYFTDAGTTLGAVRHGGFIPWDDDADLGMTSDNFQRFCELAEHGLPDGYSLHTSLNTKGFPSLWAQVFKDGTKMVDADHSISKCEQCIFVDIFVYHEISSDEKTARKQCNTSRHAQIKSYLKHLPHPKLPKNTPLKPLVQFACWLCHHTVARLWSQEMLQSEFDHAYDSGTGGGLWVDASNPGFQYPYDVLFPTREIAFDDITLRCPNNCEKYLEELYGNWKKLPPEDERFKHAPLVLDFGDGINVIEQH